MYIYLYIHVYIILYVQRRDILRLRSLEGEGDEVAAGSPQSQLVRWKSVLHSEVQVR